MDIKEITATVAKILTKDKKSKPIDNAIDRLVDAEVSRRADLVYSAYTLAETHTREIAAIKPAVAAYLPDGGAASAPTYTPDQHARRAALTKKLNAIDHAIAAAHNSADYGPLEAVTRRTPPVNNQKPRQPQKPGSS